MEEKPNLQVQHISNIYAQIFKHAAADEHFNQKNAKHTHDKDEQKNKVIGFGSYTSRSKDYS